MRRLLIRPGAIGDSILSLPALEALRAPYTEVWAPEANLPLFGFADACASIVSSGLDWLGLAEVDPPARLLERLRCFDDIVSWYGTARPEFVAAVAALGLPFRFQPALPPHPGAVHAVDFFLEQAGFPHLAGAVPRLPCPRRRCPEPFIAIQPFSGSRGKNWPLERFRALARHLPLPVAWCAGPEEPLEDAVRIPRLDQLAEWLATATLFVGNDSGISHLAAAAGAPVVAIFGPMDPRVWAPRGRFVRIVQAPDLGALDAGTVAAACQELLRAVC